MNDLAVLSPSKLDTEDYSDHLTTLVSYFEQAEDLTRKARELAERDKDYVHNDQYTREELEILKKRKQPALTINYCKRKVETMRGLERRGRADPKAFPRTPHEEQGAEAATDALRFVGEQNGFDEVRSLVYEDMVVCGYGGVDVTVAHTTQDDSKITIEHVAWERLGYDPHSVKADFSDAKYKFIVIWMDRKDAEGTYSGRDQAIETTFTSGNGDVYQDIPKDGMWTDSKRTRIRVVQMHYQMDGQWMLATFTKGGFLVDPIVSPYKDKDGKPACSLIMRSMYIDRNGNRYGAVRDFISLQDEINKRRSKALHLFTVRQAYGNKVGVADPQKAREELAKPDGFLEINAAAQFGKDFGILPTGDMASGQIELLQLATTEMQAQGANTALAGTDTAGQSGRAQQLRQQAGQLTLEPGIDALRMFAREVYEAVWMRVREFWTDQKWIRVTDDERNLKWVGLNQKVTLQDRLEQKFGVPKDQWSPEQMQLLAQIGIQSPYDPKLQQVIDVENDVSGLDVDISIEEGPDLASIQSEQFEVLSGLAKAGLPIPPRAIIQASSIRNKDLILDEMEKGNIPPQVQKQMQELQAKLQQAEQALQQANQKIADRGQEFALKSRELDIKTAEVQARNQPTNEEPENPAIAAADLHNKMADTAVKEATAEQTHMETLLMQQTPPTELTGSVSA